MRSLKTIQITNFCTKNGKTMPLTLSYQTFGEPITEAPVVLVNHALTGNSSVCGKEGWWKELIGRDKCIDTNKFAILAFDIPGNGYDGDTSNLISNYKDFVAADIAEVFLLGLKKLKIDHLFAVIGGSVGGGIAWEMAAKAPRLIRHLIPVATDWKSTDWLIANCFLQDRILNNSNNPIEDARIHAMLCYRSPGSFKSKFNRTLHSELGIFNIESWLQHHGEKLQKRFQLASYKLINQVLRTIDITKNDVSFKDVVGQIESHIHVVSVDSDLFFTAGENKETYLRLKQLNIKTSYYEIQSVHGHDAFLIEFEQLKKFLNPIFKNAAVRVA